MCDNCKTEGEIMRMLRIQPNERRDPVTLAAKRLRCYYECVTQDTNPFGDDDDDADDDTDDTWEPEY